MKLPVTTVLCALLLAGCAPAAMQSAAPAPVAADYAAALADPLRPATERDRDAARKPAEVLAFAGIRPGQKVGDYVMGGGYFTRLLAGAVGPTGRVYAFQPSEFVRFQASYGENLRTVDAAYENVTGVESGFAAPAFGEPLDAIITVQNFHDLYLNPFPEGTGARASVALFAALKPGGTLTVIDHVAAAGSGTTAADSLHRIDPAAARSILEQAGFVFEAESDLLRRSDDPHTANVFDPAIRGRTDQFMMRFRKPG
jgi:predicted methyltransferase